MLNQIQPLNPDEFSQIKFIAEEDKFTISTNPGQLKDVHKQARAQYLKKILDFINLNSLRPLKIVLNSGNGAAGPLVDELETYFNSKNIETQFVKVHHEPIKVSPVS